jgi:hypothetical protein
MRFRYLALGLAVWFAMVAMARAEDAVVADEFEQEQRSPDACYAYGPGFAKLPGTNTCARVSGHVRFEKHFSNRGGATGGQTTLDFETRSD